jgi:hypothetical protein
MSDTAQLFTLAGIWTLGAAFLVYFIPKWPVRVLVFALLVGVPFWELPYGFYNFELLCKTEGKLQVFEPIEPQRNVCATYPFDTSAQSLLKYGFESVESQDKNGDVVRIRIEMPGIASGATSKKLASPFCITYRNNTHLPWRVIRHDFLVIRSSDGVIAARHSVFDWFGMWWQQAASPVLGRGGECREDPIRPTAMMLVAGSKKQ